MKDKLTITIAIILILGFGFLTGWFVHLSLDWHNYRIVKEGDIIYFDIDGYPTVFIDAESEDKVIEFQARNFGTFEIIGK